MSLKTFVGCPGNTHAVEELLNHRLYFDLKLAAAVQGYHLRSYYSGVDHDGLDLVLDDSTNHRKFQLKSVRVGAATASWDIHRGLLRPLPHNLEALGFPYNRPKKVDDPAPWGVEGGVILCEFDCESDRLSVSYSYTDIYAVAATALGLLTEHKSTITAANTLLAQLKKGLATDKVSVAKGLFIPAAASQNLLCLAAMQSGIMRNWQARVRALASEAWGPKGETLAEELEKYRKDFPQVMKEVRGS